MAFEIQLSTCAEFESIRANFINHEVVTNAVWTTKNR